jgi:hypothetical protein
MNFKVLIFLGRQTINYQFKNSDHMRIFWAFLVAGFYNIFFYLVSIRSGQIYTNNNDVSPEDIVYIRMTGFIQIAIIIILQVTPRLFDIEYKNLLLFCR